MQTKHLVTFVIDPADDILGRSLRFKDRGFLTGDL
jgi:hypothetical protein